MSKEMRKYLNEVKKLNESGYARMIRTLRGLVPTIRTMGIITAENPYGKDGTPEYNKEMNEKLKKRLRDLNLGFVKIKGKYGGNENSLFVPNITKDELLSLGNEFNQESVIFGEKFENNNKDGVRFSMIYSDHRSGEVIGQRDVFVGMDDADDFYSEIKGRKFQIPFFDDDMDNAEFAPNSGVIQKSKVSEEIQNKLNNTINEIFEPNKTKKSKWVNRGYIKNILKGI